jgi:hypothetical protein
MDIKGFLKPTKIKIALFLIIFLFSPFIIVELGSCPTALMYPSGSQSICPDKYSVSFHPLNTLMMLLQSVGIGVGVPSVTLSAGIIVISKLIVAYVVSCLIFLLYHRFKNN